MIKPVKSFLTHGPQSLDERLCKHRKSVLLLL